MSEYGEKLARIKGELQTNPHRSERGLASKYGVSRSVVKRIKRDLGVEVDYVETSDGPAA